MRRPSALDSYFWLLCLSLGGYAILGKGYAYVGLPPVLIGEVLLVAGVAVVLKSGCAVAILTTPASQLLLAMIVLVTFRVVDAIDVHGLNALRDSVIVLYGVFAFAVAALLLDRPARIRWALSAYGRFALVFGVIGGTLTHLTQQLRGQIPVWPTSGTAMLDVRAGETGVHLAGVAIFALLGFRKYSPAWVLALMLGILLVTPSRGGMLACVIPIACAVVASGQVRRFMPMLLLVLGMFFALYAAGLEIQAGERTVGPQQVLDGLESLIGTSNASNLDGTKMWRLRWWQAIRDYTFDGPYFWTGKGFGMSLAEVDGFLVGLEFGGPPLRSPHNGHMTILARMGVPGLVLWAVTLVAWFAMMARGMLLARSLGDRQWYNLFLWIACYGLSIIIDATFDVALEGPMVGIWFWCVFGFGVGATMIYRAMVDRGRMTTPPVPRDAPLVVPQGLMAPGARRMSL
ncbi:MAG: O-antigen ligase family protein [Alphaproteobacteria bacterium]|nr:O-antigen ligase family protein [Alphaproteobacteria bacterium]